MSAKAPATEVRAHEYRLFVREGRPRFYFRNNDEGVWLSERGVGWFLGGVSHTKAWSELSTVHAQVTHIPRQGALGCCILHFAGGTIVSIITASKWGGADTERNVEYGRFLTDLHRMVPPAMREKISFQSGSGQTRHVIVALTAIVAAIFFLLLPLGMLVYFRSLEALVLAGAGAAFVWPLFRMVKASEPATYDPDAVPEHLFP